jgi:hypothetical protein
VLEEPSPYVYAILFLWVPISAMIFASTNPVRAVVYTVVFGTLFLPERAAVDPPILPPIDKNGLTMLCALVGLVMTSPRRVFDAKPFRGWDIPVLLMIATHVGTVQTNGDTFIYGGQPDWNGEPFPITVLPALPSTYVLPMTMSDLVNLWAPYFLARATFRSREDVGELLRALSVGALIYVPLMAIEMVMSPQLHRWVYGYHASNFAHAVRGSGFKPNVFLMGGLAVALFGYVSVTAATTLHRTRLRAGPIPAIAAVGAMTMALVFSRNTAVLVYLAATLPLALFARARTQARVAFVLVALFASFPYLRVTDRVPTEDLVALSARYDDERAQSLKFRFDNEDILLEKALERPWFGWGGHSRNRVFDEVTGKDISITDGEWIIHMGYRGGLGTAGWVLLFLMPIVAAVRTIKRTPLELDRLLLGGLALAVAVHAIDLLPNAAFNSIPYLLAGALAGLVSGLRQARAASTQAAGQFVGPSVALARVRTGDAP